MYILEIWLLPCLVTLRRYVVRSDRVRAINLEGIDILEETSLVGPLLSREVHIPIAR